MPRSLRTLPTKLQREQISKMTHLEITIKFGEGTNFSTIDMTL